MSDGGRVLDLLLDANAELKPSVDRDLSAASP